MTLSSAQVEYLVQRCEEEGNHQFPRAPLAPAVCERCSKLLGECYLDRGSIVTILHCSADDVVEKKEYEKPRVEDTVYLERTAKQRRAFAATAPHAQPHEVLAAKGPPGFQFKEDRMKHELSDVTLTTVRKLLHQNKTAFLALAEVSDQHPPPGAEEYNRVETMMLYNVTLVLEQMALGMGVDIDAQFPTAPTLKEALHALNLPEHVCTCPSCGRKHAFKLGNSGVGNGRDPV
jgi:hypothetical protein